MSLLTSSAACAAATDGQGMVTTWALAGSTTAYSGTYATDGYKLTATLVWKAPTTTSKISETLGSNLKTGMGTCVETLKTDGTVPTSTDTTIGNFALCHFMFYESNTGAGLTIEPAWTGTTDKHWGVSKYLTTAQWGTAGSGIIGNTMNTSGGGAAITTSVWGLVMTPTPASGTTALVAGNYVFEWYQPKKADTYTTSSLRRYGGGYNNSTADKVKAYCVSQRLLSGTANNTTGIVASANTITLSGASALTAGAIAFGVAALSI